MVEIIYPNFGRILRFSLGGKMKDQKNIGPIMKLTRGIYIQQDHDANEFDVTEYDLELNATFAERKIIENIKRIYKADNKRTTSKTTTTKKRIVNLVSRFGFRKWLSKPNSSENPIGPNSYPRFGGYQKVPGN